MSRSALLLLLIAVPVHASGITSFEPNGARDRAPMVETPIWLGATASIGSTQEPGWQGLGNTPNGSSAVGLSATWPYGSRFQGFTELSYAVRTRADETRWWGTSQGPYVLSGGESRTDLITGRTGLEILFGKRHRPWLAAGGGVGLGFSTGRRERETIPEVVARVTGFAYPTRLTRLGFMVSGGPAWLSAPETPFTFGGVEVARGGAYSRYEVSLRIESRLRLPGASTD
jgi:hypothetical protein